jgi:predicted nucleic acid-binding protein
MIKPVMLDASPLGRLARRVPALADVQRLDALLTAGLPVFVPEIADFEVRRSLLLHGLADSIAALDMLKSRLIYVPITTAVMLRAAELWSDARRTGRPTADPKELDCDVILAAQALIAGADVATENVAHLGRYVQTVRWTAIPPASPPPP